MRYFFIVFLLMLSVLSVASFAQDVPELPLELLPPVLGDFDEAALAAIDVLAVPILPETISDMALAIYQRGSLAGNNPQIFSKVGDCMTASVDYFLGVFDSDADYALGDYEDLQRVIDYFDVPARAGEFSDNSFSNPGLATTSGYNTASVQDALWADAEWCDAGESPLVCELRVSEPAFALIMFGTNDVMFFEPDFFDYNLRLIVLQIIENNTLPILYTVPWRPEFPEKIDLFNKIIVDIAQDYDIPLVNLYGAIADLPNWGVDAAEPIHLSIPENGTAGQFTPENLQYGYTVRNLLTLQVLDTLLTMLKVEG
jgi:hypothetical protein